MWAAFTIVARPFYLFKSSVSLSSKTPNANVGKIFEVVWKLLSKNTFTMKAFLSLYVVYI